MLVKADSVAKLIAQYEATPLGKSAPAEPWWTKIGDSQMFIPESAKDITDAVMSAERGATIELTQDSVIHGEHGWAHVQDHDITIGMNGHRLYFSGSVRLPITDRNVRV